MAIYYRIQRQTEKLCGSTYTNSEIKKCTTRKKIWRILIISTFRYIWNNGIVLINCFFERDKTFENDETSKSILLTYFYNAE